MVFIVTVYWLTGKLLATRNWKFERQCKVEITIFISIPSADKTPTKLNKYNFGIKCIAVPIIDYY